MKFFFSTVGLHNPVLALPLPEHMAYPVSQRTTAGLDLDYTSLLVGEGFIMDGEAFASIIELTKPFLKPMARTLLRLADAGLLRTVDMGTIISRHAAQIREKTELVLQDPSDWLRIARGQWRTVRREFEHFQSDFGSEEMRSLNLSHLPVENWLAESGQTADSELRNRLMRVMEVGESELPRALENVAAHDVRGSLRFLAAQVISTDLVRHELQLPFLNWSDSQPYYDHLYATRWENPPQEFLIQRQAGILFDLVIPELKPDSVEGLIRFVKDDKAVESLRAELFARLSIGEDVSTEWLVRYVNEAVKRGLVRQDRARRMRLLGSAAGSVLPGAGLVEHMVEETALAALEAGADRAITAPARNTHWYYALQRIARRRGHD